MNKILIIDPGKGWGHFVSKMYCYQKLSESFNSKLIFFTKKSTQAEYYLKGTSFCEDVIYIDEPKKGIKNILYNIGSFYKNIRIVSKLNFKSCFVFHPSLRYLLIAKFSNITDIWSLGLKFQSFFVKKDKRLYENFFSKTIKNDDETLEFVKKITNSNFISYKPLIKSNKNIRDTVGIIIAASGYEKRWSIENYIKVIEFLFRKNFRKFLIISGIDQTSDENLIKSKINKSIKVNFTSSKKIKNVIPDLNKCIFCIGNDTGFAHLSVNFDIPTFIIHGDCPPQSYSNLIYHIDIDNEVIRSNSSIHTITVEKVIEKISNFLKKERWPSG